MEELNRLVTDLLSSRVDRRTFVQRATAWGLSGSAIAILLDACGKQSGPSGTVGSLSTKVELKAQPGDKKVKIAFDLPSQAQLRWRFDQKFFQDAVSELGDQVNFQNANDSEAQQASQIEDFLSQSPDVLVFVPINIKSAATLVTAAAKQGVKVVAHNQIVLNSSGLNYWVARDNVAVGRLTADLAVKAKPTGNYVICSGDAGTDVAQLKTKGYMERLQPLIDKGDIKVVSQQYNRGWDPAVGQKQVEDALTANGNKIAAILCNYDGFALAALQVLKEQKLEGQVWVGGEDVFPAAAQAIVESRMAMSSYTDLQQMARLSALAAHELGNGRKPKSTSTFDNGSGQIPGFSVNSFAVTKDNMCHFINETGWVTYDKTYSNVPAGSRPTC
jgi:D-xylose transport system substrate-binding protein